MAVSGHHVGRQPVITRGLDVQAYQVFFEGRGGFGEPLRSAPTREVVRFLLRVGWRVFCGGKSFILPWDGVMEREELAQALPPGRVILAIDSRHGGPILRERLEAWQRSGIRLLYDGWKGTDVDRELVELCEFVRADLDPADPDSAMQIAESLFSVRAARIIRGVRTHEQHQKVLEAGFPLAQGDWLTTPVAEGDRKAPPPNHLVLMRLLTVLNDPDVPINTVETLVRQDVGLSYRLVRLVNSAALGLRHEVSSIGQAVMLLGMRQLRSWVSLATVTLLGQKPRELMVQAMVRAFACEAMAKELGRDDEDELFTIGLFSVLDALLDIPMEEIIEGLPLTSEVNDVLLGRGRSQARLVLECAIAHESGHFDAEALDTLELDASTITGAFLDALVKTDHVLGSLEKVPAQSA